MKSSQAGNYVKSYMELGRNHDNPVYCLLLSHRIRLREHIDIAAYLQNPEPLFQKEPNPIALYHMAERVVLDAVDV